MAALPVIAVFDVGKTNKKLLLFNAQYEVVHEQTVHLAEAVDEDGFPCENLELLRAWLHETLHAIFQDKNYSIDALNIAAYGASLVPIDESGKPLTPLYNYLKPYPEALQTELHERYGGAENFAVQTASPVLGSLNSGLQLYRIRREQPQAFQKINHALHLPQYLSYLITGQACSDITSIGCHTALWDFEKQQYHQWVIKEGLLQKLAPMHPSDRTISVTLHSANCEVGIGLHDSSAALIPYRVQTKVPFVLISTGTWCISLNPFNNTPLTANELAQDCLCYLDHNGQPVKAARAFLGPLYDAGLKRICDYFQVQSERFRSLHFDAAFIKNLLQKEAWAFEKVPFETYTLQLFENDTEAYYGLMLQLVHRQYHSTALVLNNNVTHLYIDGGFGKNEVYMNLVAAFFPNQEVYATSMAQGTALGAALAIHNSWNNAAISSSIIKLKHYPCLVDLSL